MYDCAAFHALDGELGNQGTWERGRRDEKGGVRVLFISSLVISIFYFYFFFFPCVFFLCIPFPDFLLSLSLRYYYYVYGLKVYHLNDFDDDGG